MRVGKALHDLLPLRIVGRRQVTSLERERFARNAFRGRRIIVHRLREPLGSHKLMSVDLPAGIDRYAVLFGPIAARGVEVLEREANWVGELVTAGAHGLGAVG